MSNGVLPPIQIAAAGRLPQGVAAGLAAYNVVGCTAISGGTGIWQITANDPTILPDGSWALIVFPGSGSNLPGGVSYGQSQAQTINGKTLFSFECYQNVNGETPGTPVDVEHRFILAKWPDSANVE